MRIEPGNRNPFFVSVKSGDKEEGGKATRRLAALGFTVLATRGTSEYLDSIGVVNGCVRKVSQGRPNIVDAMKNGAVALIINTPSGQVPRQDEVKIRSAAVTHRIPIMTTLRGARASISAICSVQKSGVEVCALQDYHPK